MGHDFNATPPPASDVNLLGFNGQAIDIRTGAELWTPASDEPYRGSAMGQILKPAFALAPGTLLLVLTGEDAAKLRATLRLAAAAPPRGLITGG